MAMFQPSVTQSHYAPGSVFRAVCQGGGFKRHGWESWPTQFTDKIDVPVRAIDLLQGGTLLSVSALLRQLLSRGTQGH